MPTVAAITVILILLSGVRVWASDDKNREYVDRVGKLAAAELINEAAEDNASFNGGIADHAKRVRHLRLPGRRSGTRRR